MNMKKPFYLCDATVEVNLMEWSLLQQKIGRVNAACEYIRRILDDERGYFNGEDARIVLMLLGYDVNEAEEESNETDGKEETE